MSAQPITPTDLDTMAQESRCIVRSRGPYDDTPTEILADSLEAQYNRGEVLSPEMVFEVLGRLLHAEGLCVPELGE